MSFKAYIQRQKSLIRSRRGEEEREIYVATGISPDYDSDRLMDELASLKGLNTEERLRYSKQPVYN